MTEKCQPIKFLRASSEIYSPFDKLWIQAALSPPFVSYLSLRYNLEWKTSQWDLHTLWVSIPGVPTRTRSPLPGFSLLFCIRFKVRWNFHLVPKAVSQAQESWSWLSRLLAIFGEHTTCGPISWTGGLLGLRIVTMTRFPYHSSYKRVSFRASLVTNSNTRRALSFLVFVVPTGRRQALRRTKFSAGRISEICCVCDAERVVSRSRTRSQT